MPVIKIAAERLPSPGTHIAKINSEAELITLPNGRMFITVPMVIVSGDDVGVELKDILNLPAFAKSTSGASYARKKIKNIMKAVGGFDSSTSSSDEFNFETEKLYGHIVRIKVSLKDYEGERQVNVDDYCDASDVAEDFVSMETDDDVPF